jgi:hypothetical protein
MNEHPTCIERRSGGRSLGAVIATVQVVDLGLAGALRAVARPPKPTEVGGLRSAQVALFVPLAMSRLPSLGRAGLIAFWDDDDAADRFIATDPIGRRLSGGLHARLQPLRAHGSWPGLPAEVPTSHDVAHDGPVVVATLGRLRISQTRRFLRTSRPAERTASSHDGMIWGSAAARPPFVATVSIWEDADAAQGYAYGSEQPAHRQAIAEQRRKDFHRESAFIRFAPTRLEGTLGGSNPLEAAAIAI